MALTAMLMAVTACKSQSPAKATSPATEKSTSASALEKKSRPQIKIAPASTEPVDVLVARELKLAQKDGRKLVVYVGAKWCEPCVRFHNAVANGAVDAHFPTLRLLEFDNDRDQKRLNAAGYKSQLIPLFALPQTDGRASTRFIQGGIKGDGAVGNIVPRLKKLLAQTP